MKIEKLSKKDLYYTNDHEWVDFQGSVAYAGVCQFKLLGFKKVHQVITHELTGLKKQGEVIATINYYDYQIEVHMPVDGRVLHVNENLLTGNQNLLVQQPESGGWIVLINPSLPYERKGLLLPKEYRMKGNGKSSK